MQPLPASKPASPALVELGRHLFFDPRLSGDTGRACATCHDPARGFGDGRALSTAYTGMEHFRNSPPLYNLRHRVRFLWDGRLDGSDAGTLVRDMVTEAHFMNADGRLVQERLKQVPEYVALWEAAFGKGSEPYGPRMFNALGAFMQSIESSNVPFDRWAGGDASALGAEAQAGHALFHGKARCAGCHHGPVGADGKLHRTGVPEHPDVLANPLRTITMLRHYSTSGMPNYMAARTDVGAFAITKDRRDVGRFNTPPLRELAHTAPYMHNGVFATLDEVIDFYDRGGGAGSELTPLGLAAGEKRALRAFLLSLSGDPVSVQAPERHDFRLAPWPAATSAGAAPARPVQAAPAGSAKAARVAYPPLATLPPPPSPKDNPTTAAKVDLGRKLFFDGRLSGNGTRPCSACHMPFFGWGDSARLSLGYPGSAHWRNSQTIVNAAYYNKLFWDGSVTSLEAQAPSAVEGAVAGNGDPATMELRLRFVPEYVQSFREVFGTEWPRINDAWRAIAAYQRTVVSDPAQVPFDRWLAGDRKALTPAQQRGMALFNGKAGCIRCHNGPLASDQQFHRLGVPEVKDFAEAPLLQITHRWQQVQRGQHEAGYRDAASDRGLFYVTKNPKDSGKFRTPSLREVKHTAPYMHNGAFATLAEVVEFHDRGGGADPLKSPLLKPLGLSRRDKADLVAFIESLSMDEPLMDDIPEIPDAYRPLPAAQ